MVSEKLNFNHLSTETVEVLPIHSDAKFSCRNNNVNTNIS